MVGFPTRAASPRRSLRVGLALIVLTGCTGEKPRGTISNGSASPATPASTSLKLDPGTPLMTAPVVKRLRRRLAALGIPTAQVQIAGDKVVADLSSSDLKRAQQDLLSGRLDVLLADTKTNPLKNNNANANFKLRTESVLGPKGEVTRHFLSAPAASRTVLADYLRKEVGRNAAIGPLYLDGTKRVRSYITQAGRLIRGEHIVSLSVARRAAAIDSNAPSKPAATNNTDNTQNKPAPDSKTPPREPDQTPLLRATFTPSATAGLRWHIQHGTRFLLYADGEVVAAVTPTSLGAGDTLDFPLVPRGDSQSSHAFALSLSKRMHGLALSHQTQVVHKTRGAKAGSSKAAKE